MLGVGFKSRGLKEYYGRLQYCRKIGFGMVDCGFERENWQQLNQGKNRFNHTLVRTVIDE